MMKMVATKNVLVIFYAFLLMMSSVAKARNPAMHFDCECSVMCRDSSNPVKVSTLCYNSFVGVGCPFVVTPSNDTLSTIYSMACEDTSLGVDLSEAVTCVRINDIWRNRDSSPAKGQFETQ